MGTSVEGADEVARVGQGRLSKQHVVTHGPPNLGHEHGTAVHEGPLCEDSWSPSKILVNLKVLTGYEKRKSLKRALSRYCYLYFSKIILTIKKQFFRRFCSGIQMPFRYQIKNHPKYEISRNNWATRLLWSFECRRPDYNTVGIWIRNNLVFQWKSSPIADWSVIWMVIKKTWHLNTVGIWNPT